MSPVKALLRRLPLVTLATLVAAAAGVGFQIAVSRSVDPVEFGTFTAVLALLYALAQPLEAFGLNVARQQSQDKSLSSRTITFSFAVGFIIAAIFIVSILSWGKISQTPTILVAGSLTLIAWAVLWCYRGATQGRQREVLFVLNRPMELWMRFLLGLLAISLTTDLGVIFAAGFGSAVISVIPLFKSIRRDPLEPIGDRAEASWNTMLMDFAKVAALYLPLALFIRLDVILAPQILGDNELGDFAAVGTIGKSILTYSLGLTPLIFPYLVKSSQQDQLKRVLGLGILVPVAVLGLCSIVFYFAGNAIVVTTFGEKYSGAVKILPLYLIATMPLAANFVVMHLQMARGNWRAAILVAASVVAYFLILRYVVGSTAELMLCVGGINLIVAAAGAFPALRASSPQQNLPIPSQVRTPRTSQLSPR